MTSATVPQHVAWVAAGSERWPAAAAGEHAGDAASLALAEDRALRELVEGAADLGIRWLTVQEPTDGRGLGEMDDVHVLRRAGPARLDVASDGRLVVVLERPFSGRHELVDAIARLAEDGVEPDEVSEETIRARLDLPDVDLLVKTGGDRRIPDLLLWQVAYSELVFLDVLWPDVRREHLDAALGEYRRRERRYGGVVTSR